MSIIDANDLEDGTVLRAPVCVVGGGPVGISLVLRLAELGVDSLLLESGGTEFDEDTQALYEGGSNGYFGLTTTRLRYLGGTTNHWGGQSHPLKEIDFEPQPWRDDQGWPIPRSEALSHLDQANAFLGLHADDFDTSSWYPDLGPLPDESLEFAAFPGMPLRAGEVYRDDLERSDRVTLVLHANVTQVRLGDTTPAVSSLEVRTLEGTALTAEADVFVLAAGGIESPRLLLASTADAPAGVGNGNDLVGRYFSDHHAVGPLALIPGPNAVPPELAGRPSVMGDRGDIPVPINLGIVLSPDGQRELELPGLQAFLLGAEPEISDALFAQGVEALINLDGPLPGTARSIVIGFEQVPSPESRVVLHSERNALGELQADLRWALSDDDEANMQRSIEGLAFALARAGIGRLRTTAPVAQWRDLVVGQHHHMGTLRMASSPTEGVVDPDLRFHDVPNLYAVGTAVLPTYGHVNPTLNVVALSYRLAEHLGREVRR